MSVSFLYLVSRNDSWGYDEYSEFVVCASSEDEAKRTHPSGAFSEADWIDKEGYNTKYHGWVKPSQIDTLTVKLIGFAEPTLEKGVVCASYHAG
jgi:hypothetical protein